MQDADALWYDYETEEPVRRPSKRPRLLRLLVLSLLTAAVAGIGYAFSFAT